MSSSCSDFLFRFKKNNPNLIVPLSAPAAAAAPIENMSRGSPPAAAAAPIENMSQGSTPTGIRIKDRRYICIMDTCIRVKD